MDMRIKRDIIEQLQCIKAVLEAPLSCCGERAFCCRGTPVPLGCLQTVRVRES